MGSVTSVVVIGQLIRFGSNSTNCYRLFQRELSSSCTKMSSKSHLERTEDKSRDPNIHNVTVTSISNISPTVKHVILSTTVRPVPFTFKAGQWVDLFVPGVSKIGGFTITSSPIHLQETGQLDLAIQHSLVQPAFWIHTECDEGSEVSIRIGGDFYFDPELDKGFKYLLLLAGGVGINPLSSIINQIYNNEDIPTTKIHSTLLYSAKSIEELIFRDEFIRIAKKNEDLNCKFFVTDSSTSNNTTDDDDGFSKGRIGLKDVESALNELLVTGQIDNIKVYICGPPPMIANMEQIVKKLRLTNIAYEKWW